MSPSSALDLALGSLYLMASLLGTVGNTAAFLFYLSRSRSHGDLSTSLYLAVTLTDSLICLLFLPSSLAYLSLHRSPGPLFSHRVSCAAWTYTWYILLRLSIWWVLCLTLTRTSRILRPLRAGSSGRIVALASALFTTLLLVQCGAYVTLPVVTGTYFPERAACALYVTNNATGAVITLMEWSNVVFFPVPVVVVMTTVVVSVRKLGQGPRVGIKDRASVTILLFGCVYLLCNIPCMVLWVVQKCDRSLGILAWDTQGVVMTFVWSGSICINSTVNPVLYAWRVTGFRRWITGSREVSRR